jgi:hypothetical protein
VKAQRSSGEPNVAVLEEPTAVLQAQRHEPPGKAPNVPPVEEPTVPPPAQDPPPSQPPVEDPPVEPPPDREQPPPIGDPTSPGGSKV